MLYVEPISTARLYGADGKLDETAQRKTALEELEHFFTFTLLQEMRKSVPEDGLLGDGPQRRMFEEMLDDTLSAEMARSGQLGLAQQIDEQLRAAELQAKLMNRSQALLDPDRGLPLRRTKDGMAIETPVKRLPLEPAIQGLPLTTHQGLALL